MATARRTRGEENSHDTVVTLAGSFLTRRLVGFKTELKHFRRIDDNHTQLLTLFSPSQIRVAALNTFGYGLPQKSLEDHHREYFVSVVLGVRALGVMAGTRASSNSVTNRTHVLNITFLAV